MNEDAALLDGEDELAHFSGEGIPEVIYLERDSDVELNIPGEEDSLPNVSASTADGAEDHTRTAHNQDANKRNAPRQTQSPCCLLL
jgi:hypothetical protein